MWKLYSPPPPQKQTTIRRATRTTAPGLRKPIPNAGPNQRDPARPHQTNTPPSCPHQAINQSLPHQRNHPGKPPTQPPNSQTANPPIAHEKPSHTIKLKVHQCRLKNPPICSCQYKNTTLKISHPNPKNSSAIHP